MPTAVLWRVVCWETASKFSCFWADRCWVEGRTQFLTEFCKCGSPWNMWQGLVTIGQAISEIRRWKKKKDLNYSSKAEWPALVAIMLNQISIALDHCLIICYSRYKPSTPVLDKIFVRVLELSSNMLDSHSPTLGTRKLINIIFLCNRDWVGVVTVMVWIDVSSVVNKFEPCVVCFLFVIFNGITHYIIDAFEATWQKHK